MTVRWLAGVWREQLPLALAAGFAQALALAWPFGAQAGGASAGLQVLSLAVLAWRLHALSRSHAPHAQIWGPTARWAAAFALAWLAGAWWWLYVSMHNVGGLPAPLAALAVCALALALGLYAVAASVLWVACVRRARWQQRPMAASVLFAALWLLAELLRGTWFTGFPWGAGGYAHTDGWLAPALPWVGVYGVGALAAWMAMRLVAGQTRLRPSLRGTGAVLVLCAAVQGGLPAPDSLTTPAGMGQVELLQGNIDQTDKFDGEGGVRQALAWYAHSVNASTQPLVVAPETAIALLPAQLPPDYWARWQAHALQRGQLVLMGAPWQDAAQGGLANSVLALGMTRDATHTPDRTAPPTPADTSTAHSNAHSNAPTHTPDLVRYDKTHLVPFGEFVPPGFAWFVRQMRIPLGSFVAGPAQPAPLLWQGQRLALHICYEDLFGEELAARFAQPDQAPTVLVNASNIAWFGRTVAVHQHLGIARTRALELGRPVLRASNTGATAIIDHTGRVQAQLPHFERGTLVGSYQGRNGLTPYTRWVSHTGLWPLFALALLVLGWALWAGRPLRPAAKP